MKKNRVRWRLCLLGARLLAYARLRAGASRRSGADSTMYFIHSSFTIPGAQINSDRTECAI